MSDRKKSEYRNEYLHILPACRKTAWDKKAETIPEWCPLMDLPEKDKGTYPANTVDAGYVEGWNQCIDEITGGGDD